MSLSLVSDSPEEAFDRGLCPHVLELFGCIRKNFGWREYQQGRKRKIFLKNRSNGKSGEQRLKVEVEGMFLETLGSSLKKSWWENFDFLAQSANWINWHAIINQLSILTGRYHIRDLRSKYIVIRKKRWLGLKVESRCCIRNSLSGNPEFVNFYNSIHSIVIVSAWSCCIVGVFEVHRFALRAFWGRD